MRWFVRQRPSSLPIEWEDMKAHIRLSDERHRVLVMRYVAESVVYAEARLEMSLLKRDLTAVFELGDEVVLPRGPIIPDGMVAYRLDAPSTTYSLRLRHIGHKAIVVLDDPSAVTWPLAVDYSAGFADIADIPADILGMIRIDAATRYAWREHLSAANVSRPYAIDEFYIRRGRGGYAS